MTMEKREKDEKRKKEKRKENKRWTQLDFS